MACAKSGCRLKGLKIRHSGPSGSNRARTDPTRRAGWPIRIEFTAFLSAVSRYEIAAKTGRSSQVSVGLGMLRSQADSFARFGFGFLKIPL